MNNYVFDYINSEVFRSCLPTWSGAGSHRANSKDADRVLYRQQSMSLAASKSNSAMFFPVSSNRLL